MHHIYLKKNSIKEKDKKRKTYLSSSISLHLTLLIKLNIYVYTYVHIFIEVSIKAIHTHYVMYNVQYIMYIYILQYIHICVYVFVFWSLRLLIAPKCSISIISDSCCLTWKGTLENSNSDCADVSSTNDDDFFMHSY